MTVKRTIDHTPVPVHIWTEDVTPEAVRQLEHVARLNKGYDALVDKMPALARMTKHPDAWRRQIGTLGVRLQGAGCAGGDGVEQALELGLGLGAATRWNRGDSSSNV